MTIVVAVNERMNNMIDIMDMTADLVRINQDIINRRKEIEKYNVYDFDQTWASTALGFGGVGGSAMTTARTYVLIPESDEEKAYVYFGGEFAYRVPINNRFRFDLRAHSMASVDESGRYYK